jgi:DNA-3-methyladenine glycosylase
MNLTSKKLNDDFFCRDVLEVAPDLIGKYLVIKNASVVSEYMITEVEAYKGEEDKACHASKGRTTRTEIMYHKGGRIYVYLIYGMYWMLNFVTGMSEDPQAVLIRGIEGFNGPGKLTRKLQINGTYYGEDLCISNRIWVEDKKHTPKIQVSGRIGIDYAGEPWISKPWRFFI